MSCDVCIGTDSYDPAQFCHETNPIARTEHKCCECGGKIKPREKYHRVVGKWDGDFNTYTQCRFCHEIQIVFSCGQGYFFETLWEDMEYVFDQLKTTSPCFNQLSMEAREFLVNRWWQWKDRQ